MTGTAHEQTKAHDAVAHDHDSGENRIACQPRFFGWRSDHDGDDQCRFNYRYCQGEDKRAKRLADPVRNHLSVVHCREHGAQQGDSGNRGDDSSAA